METAYKRITRFLRSCDPKEALWKLFDQKAKFVIADPTPIPRPQAKKTDYVGTLNDGKTKGFWLLVLATPHKGRAIPFHLITYSSRTISKECLSRNWYHFEAFRSAKQLIEDRPVVLDREFCYEALFEAFFHEGIHFVVRLKVKGNPPKFTDHEGREVELQIKKGERVAFHNLLYKGKIPVNVAGEWKVGLSQPLWIITDLQPQEALRIYKERMKIEESFRDLKSLLGLGEVMSKKKENMEKLVALLLIVYAICLLLGEGLKDEIFSCCGRGKMGCYSGLFVLVWLKWRTSISAAKWRCLVERVFSSFYFLVVPT